MNYISTMCVALAISFGTSSISAADLTNISAAVKGGKIVLDDNDDLGGATIDEKTAIGFNIGYDFAPNWTAEFEYVKGEFEISDTISGVTADGDGEASTIGVYAAYRTAGELYLTGRIGFVSFDGTLTATATAPNGRRFSASSDFDDSGLSYGVGGGYRLASNLQVEVDYTVVEEDTDWLMVSARYFFK